MHYSDENLRYEDGMYVITEQAVLNYGIDLRAWFANNKAMNPENMVQSFLRKASRQIYNFIHKHSVHNALQDKVFECFFSARKILYEALISQVEYLGSVGNLNNSMDANERAARISADAIDVLNTMIPELGHSILYTGVGYV